MSRGGRGGGRGRGTNKSFSREQLSSLGVGGNEVLPGPVTQPPPLFPLLDHKPIGLNITTETKYLLMLKQDFVDNTKSSPAHIKLTAKDDLQEEHRINKIDKLLAEAPTGKNIFDWRMFPSELRPKLIAKKFKKSTVPVTANKTERDIADHLDKLENLERVGPQSVTVKQEVVEEEDENEMVIEEDEEDEEMDDGTDYANNYFDNGEAYEEEEDALEDGPIY